MASELKVNRTRQSSEEDRLLGPPLYSGDASTGRAQYVMHEGHEDAEANLHFDDSQLEERAPIGAYLIGALLCPLTFATSWYCLDPYQEAVVLHCGSLSSIEKEPGCHYATSCGREIRKISTKQVSVEISDAKILDKTGNPLHVSAVIVYRVINAKRAALAVESLSSWVMNQGMATLRRVVSQFPYEVDDHDPITPCLKTHLPLVAARLKSASKGQFTAAGVDILSFQVNEIGYAPEIAASMLKRQQAHALVQARRTLVRGCTDIAMGAIENMKEKGVNISDENQVRIINNLLTVTCSDVQTVNAIPVGLN